MEQIAISLNQIFGWSIFSSVIVACLISALWAMYFNRIKEGQRAEFQKQVEELKAKQEKLNFITKVQFEAEFNMYQELSEANFQAILKSYLLFPNGLDQVPSDKDERQEVYQKRYKEATETLFELQNLLFKYAAFIKEDLYKKFEEIRLLIQLNVNYFPDIRLRDDLQLPVKFETDCCNRTREIADKQEALIKELREYLKSLKVQEG